ncbi:CopD family protein [Arsukibacterium sp.]|uniref:CopD family protein n=1 Tax=Arsukibacterium sp. TaxID=1977258 RepID=UPI001BD300A2|nr:CopD family protein [Arsukibacterium sp.]
MVWLLFLHIASLVTWAAALSILLILMSRTDAGLQTGSEVDTLERVWFTRLASPAGLIAIISGTAIFAFSSNFSSWLLLKLTLVTALVVCHVAAGLLILYSQRPGARGISGKSIGLLCTVLLLVLCIITVVLLKPQLEAFRWFA